MGKHLLPSEGTGVVPNAAEVWGADKRTMNEKTDKKFEPSFRKLERIVARLESDNLELEESLKLYEEGVGLSRFCAKVLEQAEQKVLKLARNEQGELATEDLDLPELQGKPE